MSQALYVSFSFSFLSTNNLLSGKARCHVTMNNCHHHHHAHTTTSTVTRTTMASRDRREGGGDKGQQWAPAYQVCFFLHLVLTILMTIYRWTTTLSPSLPQTPSQPPPQPPENNDRRTRMMVGRLHEGPKWQNIVWALGLETLLHLESLVCLFLVFLFYWWSLIDRLFTIWMLGDGPAGLQVGSLETSGMSFF